MWTILTHICVSSVPEFNKNFTQFQFTTSRFWVTGHSETSALNDPKMTLNPTKSNVPLMCHLGPWFPNFTPYPSTAISLRYRAFWYKCTEWPQNYLELYKVKRTPYMYNYCPWVKFHSVSLYNQLFLRYRPLTQVHRKMTPTWPWMVQVHRYLVYVLLLSTSFKFQSISLYDQPFSRCRPFWDKWITPNWP